MENETMDTNAGIFLSTKRKIGIDSSLRILINSRLGALKENKSLRILTSVQVQGNYARTTIGQKQRNKAHLIIIPRCIIIINSNQETLSKFSADSALAEVRKTAPLPRLVHSSSCIALNNITAPLIYGAVSQLLTLILAFCSLLVLPMTLICTSWIHLLAITRCLTYFEVISDECK
jgi:hypothetical protein